MNIKVLVTVLAISTATHADDQRSIAERSMKSWRALECSVLAEGMSDQGEQERLFRLGYAEGIAFLEALEAGEVADEAIRAHAPVAFLLRLGGPSHDFRMGRIFAGAVDEVYSRVYAGETDSEIKQLKAQNEFRRRNCGLLR